jgi:hypothetical protein
MNDSSKNGDKQNAAKTATSKSRDKENQLRKEQNKAIKNDYRAERKPGDEGRKSESQGEKKPWWKFWQRSNSAIKN